MSIINTVAFRRDHDPAPRVPVVIPLVEVHIDEAGALSVRLDREPYSPDSDLDRSDLQGVLAGIATDLGTPIRVEVREADCSTFTDIVTPERPRARLVELAPPVHAPGEISGGGFLPEEDIAIAVVVAHQPAAADGSARLRLPAALLEAHPGLVVLLGKQSGTVTVSGGTA